MIIDVKAPLPIDVIPEVLQFWQSLDIRLPKATIQKITYFSKGGLLVKNPICNLQDVFEISIPDLIYPKGLSFVTKDVLLELFNRTLNVPEKKTSYIFKESNSFKESVTEVSNPSVILNILRESDVKEIFTTEVYSLTYVSKLRYNLFTSLEIAKTSEKQTDVYLRVFSEEIEDANIYKAATDYIADDYFNRFGIQQIDTRDYYKIFKDMNKMTNSIQDQEKDNSYIVVE